MLVQIIFKNTRLLGRFYSNCFVFCLHYKTKKIFFFADLKKKIPDFQEFNFDF